jgi:glycopeptide antibiotics resistance protein
MLLGLLGAGNERTDVLAHLTGFFCGALLGASYARIPAKVFTSIWLQIVSGMTATAAVIGAWVWAAANT